MRITETGTKTFAAIALLLGLGLAGAAQADHDEPGQDEPGQDDPRQDDGDDDDRDPPSDGELPSDVTLTALAYAGTGCPAGSLRGELPTDGQHLLIFWDAFAAAAGPDVPLRDSRKNCQLNLEFSYPEGWQYAVESLDYSGRLALDEGVEATVASAYYFQGGAETARAQTDFVGPEERDYHVVAQYDLDGEGEGLVWSPCEARRSLNVNVQVRVNPLPTRDARGAISFADDPATAGSLLVLKWRRCPDGSRH